MHKEDEMHENNGILFSLKEKEIQKKKKKEKKKRKPPKGKKKKKRERNPAFFYNMDKPRGHYAK